MELALAVLAVVSLLMTLGMGTVTWRLLRDERSRSEARIAALVAALDGDRVAPPSPAVPGPTPGDVRAAGWPAQAAGLAAAAGIVLAVVLVAMIGLREAGGEGPASASSAPAVTSPIELLALGHEPAGAVLAIRGSVRVADASESGPLAVLATALDTAGATVASRRVDLPSLAPGAESPFTVEVPAAGVARYRISFLRGDAPVPHVDRRATARAGVAVTDPLDAAGGAS